MKVNPPEKVLQFLRWFCREDYLEEIEGDLTEMFKKQYESAPRKAKWNFIWSVIRYLRPEFLKPLKDHYQTNTYTMHTIYFKISKLLIPTVFIAVIMMIVMALAPVKINRENSGKMEAIVSSVKQGGLKDIVFSLDGVRGIYYISHITKKNLNADSLSERMIDKKVIIYYAKPRFLSYLSPMTNIIQITELRLGDEVIFSEFH
ncbi:MAG TPA: hypothetical protein DIT07_05035 [Sphingobacteriaceae bacterium]|nr:hypothetical protein [Sphingobacteriaceae bacterium]